MTQEEIIELARQAGAYRRDIGGAIEFLEDFMLERFAKLIAEKEREACAMLCLWHNNTLTQNPTLFHMAELIRTRGQA